ncbi:LamG-like jellyroll fold domain-containing protein [Streptomyces sp. SCSIO 75703]|uniref:LamG-like jellyroll fold domain-containing protein n=2 Tax=Streptomyces sp. SCSIO 75703 TaxID=3112165 RepID=UPI0030CBB870
MALALGSPPALSGEAVADTRAASPRTGARTAGDAGGLTDTEAATTAATETEAFAEAEKTGEAVEIASLRGETREVFATPEGELEAREHLRPVWTRTGGGWKRIDTDLTATAGGAVAPKASTMDMEFSGGGDGPLVRMRRAGRELSLSWPTPLPRPETAGPVATYRSVLPDVDLRLTAQEDGFTQLLVVKTAEAAAGPELARLRLEMDTRGLSVTKTGEGGLQALDQGARGAVFEAPKPMMWDSSPGETATGAPQAAGGAGRGTASDGTGGTAQQPGAGESGKLAPVEVEVPAGQNALVLTPDADVLKGEDTVYPVYIDPQWYSPRASAWTMVSKYWANSPQWKFNGESDAGMGYCNWSYCRPHDTKRLFYRIPTSRFAGTSILSAEFVVRNTWSASCSARTVELYETKGISSSTTWADQDNSGFWPKKLASESFAYGYSGCAAKDAEFNVKSAVQAAADRKDASMTFGLRAASESDGNAWKRFSDKAYLRVRYNRPPAQIKMSQLTMEYGGTWKKPTVRTLGRSGAGEGAGQLHEERPQVKGRWTFETAHGSPLVTPDVSAEGNAMTLYGGAEIGSGWVDGGVHLDGVDDYGVTSAVPVDTGNSFTISVWAQAAAVPEHGVALLGVPGTTRSAFTVRYEPSATPETDPGRWRIVMAAADTGTAAVTHVDNGQFFSPTEWTHLALVYDGFAKHLALYVNGELEELACADADGDGRPDGSVCTDRLSWADDVLAYTSEQPLQLGRAHTGAGTWGDYWPGSVSDLWAFQGALTAVQVRHLAVGMPGLPTEVPGEAT